MSILTAIEDVAALFAQRSLKRPVRSRSTPNLTFTIRVNETLTIDGIDVVSDDSLYDR